MENCKFTTSRSVKRYKFLFVLAILLSSFLSVYAEDVSNYVEEKTFTFSFEYLQPIINQYFIGNKSEIWSLSLMVHSKRRRFNAFIDS